MQTLWFATTMAAVPFLVYAICKGYRKRLQSQELEVLREQAVPSMLMESEEEPMPDKPASILIIDDQPAIRLLLREALQSESVEVHEASTGCRAMDIIKLHRCSIVIMDVRIPDMNVIDWLHQLRALRPKTEVIIISAYREKELVRRAKGAGAIAYFTKPFDLEEVSKFVTSRISPVEYHL
ncbi:response regulator [Paenibacillus assamensis]|uniref:response regulator n=1 Tax=Paenibacillus assamensis TaxID=311244 RepID=UPI00048C6DAB|nr:response regulator [Paenibacillus assamensis]